VPVGPTNSSGLHNNKKAENINAFIVFGNNEETHLEKIFVSATR
jgi:hypothetical protein